MKCLFQLSLLAITLLMSSCANMEHLPPAYQGPVATIDQTVRVDDEKRNCGFVLAIDDKPYEFSGVSKLKPIFNIQAGKHRLLLRGHVVYMMEIRNLAPPPHAEGWVDVSLEAGKRYRVMTETTESGTSVWLNEIVTGKPVSPILLPGSKR